MRRVVTASVVAGVAAIFTVIVAQAVCAAESLAKDDASAKAAAPADRVVVMYFHRTQRCPTCLKMGGFSEEAVKTGFARELQTGTVEFHYIDFQDKKNEAITKGYNVSGPTLIVAKVANNKVADLKSLTDIWTKVRDKTAFFQYVQDNVHDYLK